MKPYLHVSSSRNRASIRRFGLDWTRMGARGIAGSTRPEVDGCFLCVDDFEEQWFIDMNNTGGPVDVWEVHGVADQELVESATGQAYVPRKVGPQDLRLVLEDIPPGDGWAPR